jgi:hypothetical protein
MSILFSCECGQLLTALDEHEGCRFRCHHCGSDQAVPALGPLPRFGEVGRLPPASGRMFIISGDLDRPYEVIRRVMGCAECDEGLFGARAGGEAYRAAMERLREEATGLEADAIIRALIRVEIENKGTASDPVQAFRVSAWGTAVRLRGADRA